MTIMKVSAVATLMRSALGGAAEPALAALKIDARFDTPIETMVDRAVFAMALNAALFGDLLTRVPTGAAYVAERVSQRQQVVFDHGALRTIRFENGSTGALPAGHLAFARILEPLGYEVAGLYPLPRLKMTGRAYRHRDAPADIPQFFVSELLTDQFSPAFQETAHRVFDSSHDPLDSAAQALLDVFSRTGAAPFDLALAAFPTVLSVFGRQHAVPALADYEALLESSAEAAWIATEGNAFNHATDRVADVEVLAMQQRALGRPMKEKIEVSSAGSVRQTAFHADLVEREFFGPTGHIVRRTVPGSFYEFISRDRDPRTGHLDLRFDTGNAQGIFAMTRSA